MPIRPVICNTVRFVFYGNCTLCIILCRKLYKPNFQAELSPGENNFSLLSIISLKDISGCANINLVIMSVMYPASVASFFKNLRLAGVLKNRFSTSIACTVGNTCLVRRKYFSAFARYTYACFILVSLCKKASTSATAPILERASPLKPKRINCVKVTARFAPYLSHGVEKHIFASSSRHTAAVVADAHIYRYRRFLSPRLSVCCTGIYAVFNKFLYNACTDVQQLRPPLFYLKLHCSVHEFFPS